MKAIRLCLVLLLATLFVGLMGCDKSRPGVTKKFTGEYTRYYPATGDDVHAAIQRVFSKLEMMPVEDTYTLGRGKTTARNFQNTQVSVRIKQESPQSTYVALKVDPGESEAFGVRLLQMINEELTR